MSKRQTSLQSFFNKKPKLAEGERAETSTTPLDQTESLFSEPSTPAQSTSTPAQSTSKEATSPETTSPQSKSVEAETFEASAAIKNQNESIYDISNFVNKNFPVETRVEMLNQIWTPPSSFKFPAQTRERKTQTGETKQYSLRFQHNWLQRFMWLSYSSDDTCYCRYCVIFGKTKGGANQKELGFFVLSSGQDRLNGLALMSICREIEITENEIIDELAKAGRRVDLLL